jgi:hypothetical protein
LTADSIQQKYAQALVSTRIVPGCVQFLWENNVLTQPGPKGDIDAIVCNVEDALEPTRIFTHWVFFGRYRDRLAGCRSEQLPDSSHPAGRKQKHL